MSHDVHAGISLLTAMHVFREFVLRRGIAKEADDSPKTNSGYVHMLAMMAGLATAQQATNSSTVTRQSMDDALWTGPMLAPSAATLPRRHFLIEPYLYGVTTQGRFDSDGARRSAPHPNGFGSLTYVLYGLADKVSIGVSPWLATTR